MKRFVGLDGIKGMALIAIVLYHCRQSSLPGGFYGVDVFFTVSGFLIATSLFRSYARSGRIDLAHYAVKRLVRLYPALVFMMLVVISAAWFWFHDALVSILNQVITVVLCCYNWYAIAGGQSYFDQMNPQIFRHLWFVSVLMQFYVVVPLICAMMWKIRHSRCSALIPLGLAMASSAEMWLLYQPGDDPTRVYFGTDTHATGLLLGVALAWWVTGDERRHAADIRLVAGPRMVRSQAESHGQGSMPRSVAETPWRRAWAVLAPALAFASLLVLCAMMVHGAQNDFAFRGGITLASILSVLLIAGTIVPGSWMRDLMVFRPFDMLGRYSYGIYLWHWPVWILASATVPRLLPLAGPWALIVVVLITLLMAVVSWVFVEQPAAGESVLSVVVPRGGHVFRSIAVDVVVVAALPGMVQGIANAPIKTTMQMQLEEQSRQLQEQAALNDELLRHPTPTPPKPRHMMPSGSAITAIGDSVMLASSQGLNTVFPGVYIDAAVSRSIMVAPDLVQGQLNNGTLRSWVVFGLGTNGAITTAQLDQLKNMLGPDRVMVLVTAHGDRSWIPVSNQAMQAYAAAHADSVVLADWDSAAASNPQVLGADGIHPGLDTDLYAQTVKQAIERWIEAGH